MMGKQEELLHFMELNNIHITVIQETKFTTKSKMKPTPNYTLVRRDRGEEIKGGGLAFLVHETVLFEKVTSPLSLSSDPHLEELTILISQQDTPLMIRNIYIPPVSSCTTPDYRPPINSITDGLGDSALVLGDFNGHHHLWHSRDTEDTRGKQIADWLSDTNLGIVNEDTPTRVTAQHSTAPDITIATPDLLPALNRSVTTALSSDHLPILISMSTKI